MRTLLLVPGDRPDRFAAAAASGADTLVLDLHRSVAEPRKHYARDAVAEYLTGPLDLPVQVRIGPRPAADIAAVLGRPGLAGLRLTSVRSAEQVARVAIDAPRVPLYCMLGSALGVEKAFEIATAHRSIAGVCLDEDDLCDDLGVSTEDGLVYARSRVVLAARAAGLAPPTMGEYRHADDLDGLAASCRTGRAMGFRGRLAVDERQLAVIAAAFTEEDAAVVSGVAPAPVGHA